MPVFDFEGPDGKVHSIEGPMGSTPEQAHRELLSHLQKNQGTAKLDGKIPSPEPMGGAESFMTGLGDPMVGAKQLYEHGFGSPESIAETDKAVREREKGIQSREGGGFVRGLGAATTGAPLMALGPAGAVAGGVAQGLLNPVTAEGDFLGHKTKEAAVGGIMSAVPAGLGKGAAGVLGTAMRPDAMKLAKSGVELTPGQAGGPILRRLEEAAKSIPILGNFVRNAETRSIESFNRAVIDQTLEPIGGKLPQNVKAGHAAINEGYKQIKTAYDTLLPNQRLAGDNALVNDFSRIRQSANTLPADHQKQYESILKEHVLPFFNPANTNRPGIKDMESSLRYEADLYRKSQNPNDVKLAAKLDDVRDAVHDALLRQNPNTADLLRKIDLSYAMFARAQGAATRRATSEAVFTPNDLLQTIKSQEKSARKGAFARGDSLMQVYAETGQRVLPGKLPDSGTAERGLTITQLPLGLAALPAAPIWSRTGTGMVRKALQPGPDRQTVQSILRRGSPYAGIGMEPILNQVLRGQNGTP